MTVNQDKIFQIKKISSLNFVCLRTENQKKLKYFYIY